MVKWADTEKERQARRAQKALSLASNVPNPDSRQHLYGALPMGYIPPYNGYGYQVCFIIEKEAFSFTYCNVIFKWSILLLAFLVDDEVYIYINFCSPL